MTSESGVMVLRLQGEVQHRGGGVAGAVCVRGHIGPFPGEEEGFGFFAGASEGTGQGHTSPSCKNLWDVALWFLGQVWRRETDWIQNLETRDPHGHFSDAQCRRLQSAFPPISSFGTPPLIQPPHRSWDCYYWVAFHKYISLLYMEGAHLRV